MHLWPVVARTALGAHGRGEKVLIALGTAPGVRAGVVPDENARAACSPVGDRTRIDGGGSAGNGLTRRRGQSHNSTPCVPAALRSTAFFHMSHAAVFARKSPLSLIVAVLSVEMVVQAHSTV